MDYLVKANPELYAAYLGKERLRLIFKQDTYRGAICAYARWLKWARKCGILEFEELAKKIERNGKFILSTVKNGLSSGKLEAKNNVIKSIIRRAFGFRNVDNLIGLILLRTSNWIYDLGEGLFHIIG